MADYIIVGGGIYGCALAWELAKRGGDSLLLEARTIASGASGGLGERGVRANGRDLRELPLMRQAYEIWPRLHEEIGGFHRLSAAGASAADRARENDLAAAHAQSWLQNQQGIESHLLDRGQTRDLEPQLSDKVIGAIFCPHDGVADHSATTRSMAVAALAAGADIIENARVIGMRLEREQVRSLRATIAGPARRDPRLASKSSCSRMRMPPILWLSSWA